MSNVTFLISAVLTVVLLQGFEQTQMTQATDSSVQAPGIVLDAVQNGNLSLKPVGLELSHPVSTMTLTAQASVSKS